MKKFKPLKKPGKKKYHYLILYSQRYFELRASDLDYEEFQSQENYFQRVPLMILKLSKQVYDDIFDLLLYFDYFS